MWIHRVPLEAALFRSAGDRCNLTSWRPPRRRLRYCKVPLTYCRARILLLLPPHVLFTGSSSETWSNGWLSLPNYQRQQCVDALIAQAMVLGDFCAVFSSWAKQLPSDAVASFFFSFFFFFSFCLRTHLTNVCRPAAGNNCFGRRPIVHFWTERAVPAGRVPDTSRHSPRLLIRICAGDRHSRGTLQPPEHRVDMVQASGTGLPSTYCSLHRTGTNHSVFSRPVPARRGGEHCRF